MDEWTWCTTSPQEGFCVCTFLRSCLFVRWHVRETDWEKAFANLSARPCTVKAETLRAVRVVYWTSDRLAERSDRLCGKPVGVPKNSPCHSDAPSKRRDALGSPSQCCLSEDEMNAFFYLYSQCY